MKYQKLIYILTVLLFLNTNTFADDTVLDFEGLQNYEQVENFYNGGTGSEGSTKGLDYGITFSSNTLALIDSDAGGSGNFADEPSSDTIFFFTGSDTNIYMNVEDGFTEGFSFYYTSVEYEGDVEVWTEANGQGKKIGTLHLDITPSLGEGDPNGRYDNWAKKSLSFDGRAKSIVFSGVANQIGFDNITLNPNVKKDIFNHKFTLDKITHTAKTDIANTFTIYFKNLETTKDDVTLSEICDYEFFVEDKNQNKTKSNELKGNCEVNVSNEVFKLNFTVTELPYNIEDGNVTICKDNECEEIDDIENFSVYGTDFDVTKDGFSFGNGKWNQYMFIRDEKEVGIPCQKTSTCTQPQMTYTGQMNNLVNALKEFLPGSKKATVVKSTIGYYESIEDKENKKDKVGGAMCHGLAVSAIANFNNRNTVDSWGTGINTSLNKTEIKNIFRNHWDDRSTESAKPFSEDTHNYDTDYFETAFYSLAKIAYYYVSQYSYKGSKYNDGDIWVGKHEREFFKNIDDMNTHHKDSLKLNKTSIFSFSIQHLGKDDGGHSIVATALIKYNGRNIYVLHDNNYIDMFSMLDFTDKFKLYNFIFSKEKFTNHMKNAFIEAGYTEKIDELVKSWIDKKISDEKIINYNDDFYRYVPYNADSYYKFRTYTNESDELFVYGKSDEVNKQLKVSKQIIEKDINEVYEYSYPNHILITIIGGKLLKVIDTQTNKEIILNPIMGILAEDKGYLKDNLLITEFLLPKNSIYQIEVQKYKQYPVFEIYAKIPNDSGKVEIINYENLATNQNDITLVHFLVGNGNSEKVIKREGESDVAPTYDEAIEMELTSVVSINAIVLENGVKLLWQNPAHPNYQESVVVRKENNISTSITDGTEIYRGTDEEFLDITVSNEKKYYYAVYAISKKNEPTEPVWTVVDTYKYTLYGTLTDANNEPITGATVTLYNETKTRLIETSFSSHTGLFSFNNLLDGEYVLNFSHSYYRFEKSELNVTVEKKSKEVLLKGEGVANLFMNIPQVAKVGESQTIVWDGIHIDESEIVNIKLFRDDKWETIASNVPYSQHAYKWNVTAPQAEAKLRVELDDTTFVEEDIIIFGNNTPPENVTPHQEEVSSKSGGGALGYLLPLLMLGLLLFRRKD